MLTVLVHIHVTHVSGPLILRKHASVVNTLQQVRNVVSEPLLTQLNKRETREGFSTQHSAEPARISLERNGHFNPGQDHFVLLQQVFLGILLQQRIHSGTRSGIGTSTKIREVDGNAPELIMEQLRNVVIKHNLTPGLLFYCFVACALRLTTNAL